MFLFSSDPFISENYTPSPITYYPQINFERGKDTSLFFIYRDNYGFGIDLSNYNAAITIKRYPSSNKILFYMDEYSVLYGSSSDGFIYSPTADTIGIGGSLVNRDAEGNSLTGGIVFPLASEDTAGLPLGNHYYEIFIKNSQERKILFEGRIDLHDPISSGATFEPRQKDIEISQGETTNLFFKHIDNYGIGIDLTGKKILLLGKRYPSSPNTILNISEEKIVAGDSNGSYLEMTSASGGTFTFININPEGGSMTGGIKFYIPEELTSAIPSGRYFYDISISGGNQQTKIFEGRMDILTKFYDIPLSVNLSVVFINNIIQGNVIP